MTAILYGRDHTELDRSAGVTLSPRLAIALSRGRTAKRYHYVDPNEDVVAAVPGRAATALIVADGHNGHEASHAAVDALVAALGPDVPSWGRRDAVLVVHDVNRHIRGVRRQLSGPNRSARTTLTLAVVAERADGTRLLTHVSVGDSVLFVISDGTARPVSKERHRFLGDDLSEPEVAGSSHYGQIELDRRDAVVLVSDGYTNFARPAELPSLLERDPQQSARRIIDHAGNGGAGDNVAVAVLLPATHTNRNHADGRPI